VSSITRPRPSASADHAPFPERRPLPRWISCRPAPGFVADAVDTPDGGPPPATVRALTRR
jgi:hypothetical protein